MQKPLIIVAIIAVIAVLLVLVGRLDKNGETGGGEGASTPHEQIIKTRVARFKAHGEDIQAVFRKDMPARDFDALVQHSRAMSAWSGELLAHFPQGSVSDGTRAKIWENWDDFTSLAHAHQSAAETLAMRARTAQQSGDGNIDALMMAAKQLGGTCKACHDVYRIKK